MPGKSESHLRIPMGTANSYLIRARDGYVVVDAGYPFTGFMFFRALRRNGIGVDEIKLVIVTHVHYDHVGKLKAIAGERAPVMVQREGAHLLEQGRMVTPEGTNPYGRVVAALGRRVERILDFTPCKADYVVDEEASLEEFGLDAVAMHTPGHTADSMSVLLQSGEAFVGDTCFNVNYPFGHGGPIFPPFANDVDALYESWRKLMDAGVKRIYPGHGSPFGVERLRAKYEERKGDE